MLAESGLINFLNCKSELLKLKKKTDVRNWFLGGTKLHLFHCLDDNIGRTKQRWEIHHKVQRFQTEEAALMLPSGR